MISLTCGIFFFLKKNKVKLIETEQNGGFQGQEGWGKERDVGQKAPTSSCKQSTSRSNTQSGDLASFNDSQFPKDKVHSPMCY